MEKQYKSTAKRLVVFFERSRTVWKGRALQYQAEKRALQIKIRDLKKSKENWKTRTKKLESQIEESKKKQQKIEEIKHLIANL